MRYLQCYKKDVSILPLYETPRGYYGQCNSCAHVVPKYIPDSWYVLLIAKIVKKITKDYSKVIEVLQFLRLYKNDKIHK